MAPRMDGREDWLVQDFPLLFTGLSATGGVDSQRTAERSRYIIPSSRRRMGREGWRIIGRVGGGTEMTSNAGTCCAMTVLAAG